jgi:hypothetical protein
MHSDHVGYADWAWSLIEVHNLLYDLRSDDLARATPCSEAVEDHERIFLSEGAVEV